MDDQQTIVVYHLDDEETPYRSKLKKRADEITLLDFKTLLVSLPTKTYKFFFKSEDADFGVVKEEINDDKSKLPILNGRIEAWLVSVDSSSAHSDTTAGRPVQDRRIIAETAPESSLTAANPPGRQPLTSAHSRQKPVSYQSVEPASNADRFGRNARRAFDNQSACTSDTESTVAGLPRISRFDQRFDRRSYRQHYYNRARPTSHPRNLGGLGIGASVTNSELENTSYFDSDDDQTNASFSTDITSVSRQYLKRRKKKRRFARGLASKVSEVSSVTESSASLNIITVTLNIEPGGFLGISIVGRSDYPNGDGGIYVSAIMKGGAVALDGRIEQGDMILQVNDIPFHNVSNDDAVRILQRLVKEPGPIKLIVAKSFESNLPLTSYVDFRHQEPVRPIDPGAWVAHTTALLAAEGGAPTPLTPTASVSPRALLTMPPAAPPIRRPPSSAATASSNNSGSFTGRSAPAAPQASYDDRELKLDKNCHDMHTIVKYMARPDSGLEVKTRTWLKIEIPDAFMGSNLVDWLFAHVDGFSDRKDAKKYASQMLKEGYIKHTVNKFTFTEQCYYIFSNVCDDFAGMRLDGPRDDCSATFSDPDPVPGILNSAIAQPPLWAPPLHPATGPEMSIANQDRLPSAGFAALPPGSNNLLSGAGSAPAPVLVGGIAPGGIGAAPLSANFVTQSRSVLTDGQSATAAPPSYGWATTISKLRNVDGAAAASSVSGGSAATSSGCSAADRLKAATTSKVVPPASTADK